MKRVLGLTIAILLIGLTGTGSWAYFTDVETTSENIFAAGTLDLKTNDIDGVSQTLTATNMKRGEIIGPETITLKNTGSIAGTSLNLSFTYSENDDTPNPINRTPDDTAANIELTMIKYDGSSLLASVLDNNSNGYRDIHDLKNTDFGSQAGMSAQESKEFEIALKARSDVDSDFQADGISITMSFILNQ